MNKLKNELLLDMQAERKFYQTEKTDLINSKKKIENCEIKGRNIIDNYNKYSKEYKKKNYYNKELSINNESELRKSKGDYNFFSMEDIQLNEKTILNNKMRNKSFSKPISPNSKKNMIYNSFNIGTFSSSKKELSHSKFPISKLNRENSLTKQKSTLLTQPNECNYVNTECSRHHQVTSPDNMNNKKLNVNINKTSKITMIPSRNNLIMNLKNNQIVMQKADMFKNLSIKSINSTSLNNSNVDKNKKKDNSLSKSHIIKPLDGGGNIFNENNSKLNNKLLDRNYTLERLKRKLTEANSSISGISGLAGVNTNYKVINSHLSKKGIKKELQETNKETVININHNFNHNINHNFHILINPTNHNTNLTRSNSISPLESTFSKFTEAGISTNNKKILNNLTENIFKNSINLKNKIISKNLNSKIIEQKNISFNKLMELNKLKNKINYSNNKKNSEIDENTMNKDLIDLRKSEELDILQDVKFNNKKKYSSGSLISEESIFDAFYKKTKNLHSKDFKKNNSSSINKLSQSLKFSTESNDKKSFSRDKSCSNKDQLDATLSYTLSDEECYEKKSRRELNLTNIDNSCADKDDFQKFYEEMNLKLLNYK